MRYFVRGTTFGLLGLFLWNSALGQDYPEERPEFDTATSSCGQMMSYVERKSHDNNFFSGGVYREAMVSYFTQWDLATSLIGGKPI